MRRIRPKHARAAVVASALAAALLGFLAHESPPDPDVLALDYVVSPDAKPLLEPMVREFNASGTTFSGQVVRVTLADRSSGKRPMR
jgi:hypothetical protein